MLKRIGLAMAAGVAAAGRGAARIMPSVLRDCAGLAGVGLISYGAWLIQPAAGFIAGGVLLLAGAVLASVKGSG